MVRRGQPCSFLEHNYLHSEDLDMQLLPQDFSHVVWLDNSTIVDRVVDDPGVEVRRVRAQAAGEAVSGQLGPPPSAHVVVEDGVMTYDVVVVRATLMSVYGVELASR